MVVVARSPERHGGDRYVVDRPWLDDGRRRARRDAVEVGLQLLIEAHERPFLVLADQKPDDDHRLSGARRGIEVFDAGHFPQQFLHRPRDALLDFRRRRAWKIDEDVHHRNDDLRLLFTRQCGDGERAERHRAGDEERCQLRRNEGGRQPARDAESRAHGRPAVPGRALVTVTGEPSSRRAGGADTIGSPASTPASTSTPAGVELPVCTRRSRATLSSTTKTEVTWPYRRIAVAGTCSERRGAPRKNTRANVPVRAVAVAGSAMVMVNARWSTPTARATSVTTASKGAAAPAGSSIATSTRSPRRTAAARASSTRTDTSSPALDSMRTSGMPGAARFPGSMSRSVTIPSNGARSVANDSVVVATSAADWVADSAALAPSKPACARSTRAAATARRASASSRS